MCLLGSRAVLYFWTQIIHCLPRIECIAFTMPLSLAGLGLNGWELRAGFFLAEVQKMTCWYCHVWLYQPRTNLRHQTLNTCHLPVIISVCRFEQGMQPSICHCLQLSAPKEMEAMKQKTCGFNLYKIRASFKSVYLLQKKKKACKSWCFVTVLLTLAESYFHRGLFIPFWA